MKKDLLERLVEIEVDDRFAEIISRGQQIIKVLERMEQKIDTLNRKVDDLPTSGELNSQLDEIDAAIAKTDADVEDAKSLIADLEGQIAAGGLPAEEVQALSDRLEATKAALAALEVKADEVTPDPPV